MRWPLILVLLVTQVAWATKPSDAIIRSCAGGRQTLRSVILQGLPAHGIDTEDDYKFGYNATYFFNVSGKDIGYAERGHDAALIYAGRLYLLRHARSLTHGEVFAPFNPFLADWNMVSEGHASYLCVSFNFDGLGRSGNSQNIRGGYLLDTKTAGASNNFYYFVIDINQGHLEQ